MIEFKTTAGALTLALGLGLAALPHTATAQDTVTLSMATPWSGGHWLEIGANSYA